MRSASKKRLGLLHLSLDGQGPQPFTQWLSRVCEEFHCLPSEAWREQQRLPVGLLEEIIEARAYASLKMMFDSATTAEAHSALPDTPLMVLVMQITAEVAQEQMR